MFDFICPEKCIRYVSLPFHYSALFKTCYVVGTDNSSWLAITINVDKIRPQEVTNYLLYLPRP